MENFKKLFRQFLSFKSISTDSAYVEDITKTAEWLSTLLIENGFQSQSINGYGNPIVVASFNKLSNTDTVLIYGHYDVQPASIDEGWSSDPFTYSEKNGKVFSRGSVDNKGQILIHISTVLDLIKENKLKYNVKFIIEGNEETGSPELERFVSDNQDLLKADFVLFSDGELTANHPTIDIGYRGIYNTTLTIETSLKDNHSGLYGGSMPSSSTVLTKVLSGLHNEDGLLQLPDLDNSIDSLDQDIIEDNLSIPYSDEDFENNTGAKTRLNKKLNFYLQTGYLTSAEITGIKSGYTAEGYRNAIPGKSIAKINFRISPLHKLEDVRKSFDKYLEKVIPTYAKYELSHNEMNDPIRIDLDNKYIKEVKEVLEIAYKTKSLYKACGAIVPVAGLFKDILKIPVVSVGLGNEDCNMHGANENFDVELIEKGLEFSREFLGKL